MAMNTVINTNMRALTAHRNLSTVGNRQNKANQRLSSGKKINSAADDAAGLAISEKMKAQIKGLDMASKNSEDAISLIQTAEGSLTEVNNMLTRVRELTAQAANDTNQQEDRVKIAEEVAQLLTEIDSISSRTEFNEKKLNDGSFQDGFFQIGANAGQKLELGIGNMSVFGISADKIMDTFGIEKNVDLDIKTTGGIVFDNAPTKAKVETNAVNQATASGTGKFTISYKDAGGRDKSISVDVDLDSTAQNSAKLTGEKIRDTLLANKEFSEVFTVSAAADGKLTIEAKEAGMMSAPTIKWDAGTATGSKVETNTTAIGTAGKIDVTKAENGDTVTIAGKTFIKVADAEAAKSTVNSFHDAASFKDLLAKEGIEYDDTTGEVKMMDAQNSALSGNYSVNSKNVSDKGKEFSELLDDIDESLKTVTTQRSKLGANQNRLEYTINNLNITSENLSAAKSRIEDTDMAKEMMNLTSANVLQQAATSMLAQANQAPQSITQLLG